MITALELFNKFYDLTPNEAWFNEPVALTHHYNARELAKQCALLTVNEIINSRKNDSKFDDTRWIGTKMYESTELNLGFWLEVKKELERIYEQ